MTGGLADDQLPLLLPAGLASHCPAAGSVSPSELSALNSPSHSRADPTESCGVESQRADGADSQLPPGTDSCGPALQ